jgi:ABC-type transporter Mla subunit MlaD
MVRLVLPSAMLAFLLAGCAAEGDYPSLEPRAVERELAEADPEPPAPLPDDPALAERVAALTAEARRGDAEFETALPAARAAVAGAGSAGGESWIEAQQALSRLEAARGATAKALADLDALALAEARRRPLSGADLERLRAAVAALQEIADRQHDEMAGLRARLGRI